MNKFLCPPEAPYFNFALRYFSQMFLIFLISMALCEKFLHSGSFWYTLSFVGIDTAGILVIVAYDRLWRKPRTFRMFNSFWHFMLAEFPSFTVFMGIGYVMAFHMPTREDCALSTIPPVFVFLGAIAISLIAFFLDYLRLFKPGQARN